MRESVYAPFRSTHVITSDSNVDDTLRDFQKLLHLLLQPIVVQVPAQSTDKDGPSLLLSNQLRRLDFLVNLLDSLDNGFDGGDDGSDGFSDLFRNAVSGLLDLGGLVGGDGAISLDFFFRQCRFYERVDLRVLGRELSVGSEQGGGGEESVSTAYEAMTISKCYFDGFGLLSRANERGRRDDSYQIM